MFARIAGSYRSAYSGLPATIWGLALVAFVNRSGTMVLTFLFLYMTQELGFSPAQAGRVLALYGIGAMVGSQLGGWLTDRLGSWTTQVLSLTGTAVLFLLLEHVEGVRALSLLVFLLATVNESLRPANAAAIAENSAPEQRPRSFGLTRMAMNLGMAIGPALGGLLAVRDYSWLFRVDAATCLAAALTLHLLRRPASNAVADDATESARSPWSDGWFLAATFFSCVVGIVFMQIFSTFPLFLKEVRGMREDMIGAVFAINPVLIVVVEMVLLGRIERYSPMRVCALGALLVGAGFGMMALGASLPWIALTVVTWTLGEMLWSPMILTFTSLRAGARSRGRYMGLFALSFGLAGVLAPVLGPAIYEQLSPFAVWYAAAAGGALAALGFLAVGRGVQGAPGQGAPGQGAPDQGAPGQGAPDRAGPT